MLFNDNSQTAANTVPGYTRFRRTSAYLEKHTQSTNDLPRLLASLFPDNTKGWYHLSQDLTHLRREVPYLFLSAVSAEIETVMALCEEDRAEFERNRYRKDLRPRHVIVRYMPAVYMRKDIPFAMHEEEAISYIQEQFCLGRFWCAVNFPEFKTLYIEPDGSSDTIYYPPGITVKDCSLVPSADGRDVGIMHIG